MSNQYEVLGKAPGAEDLKNLSSEDIHYCIEEKLISLIGETGKKLHTGRSRNDQVGTDIRLWLRKEIDNIENLITDLQKSFLNLLN